MFKCQCCGRQSLPREKGEKVVTKTRPRKYEYLFEVDSSGKKLRELTHTNSVRRGCKAEKLETTGYDIVEEILICEVCTKEVEKL